MKLLGGAATKKRTASLTPLLLTLAVILGLLDQHRCLALKCYQSHTCPGNGPTPCSEVCGAGHGDVYCVHETRAVSGVGQYCMPFPEGIRKCVEKKSGLNFNCAELTGDQFGSLGQQCAPAGAGSRSGPFATRGARQDNATEESSNHNENGNKPQKICFCNTDNCNKECKCGSGGGKGAAGSKRSSVAVQGILMTIPVMAVTLLFSSV